MKELKKLSEIQTKCWGISTFSDEIIEWITSENLWNIWVPKSHGGMESSLSEGLAILRKLAQTDGSLAWTITLCSGANYFIGNLEPDIAKTIFSEQSKPVFGGSGGLFGYVEKKADHYEISGRWKYATGAPHLTHFTLNAKHTENGKEVMDENGNPKFSSFLVPAYEVEIINDWNCMGLQATVTNSFELKNVRVEKNQAFHYNEFYLPQAIFKIPFRAFADLTLWMNYIGMAEHFSQEAEFIINANFKNFLLILNEHLKFSMEKLNQFAIEIENKIESEKIITSELLSILHKEASSSIKKISQSMISVYPFLGIKACSVDCKINQIFSDYFTATQHHNFSVR